MIIKWLLQLLGLRHYTPRPFGKLPRRTVHVEPIDTGGGGWYRPTHRKQDPSADPKEPYGSESSSSGNDHGWSNCTMTAAAMALEFATLGSKKVWGGDMRHHQSDLSGGTDLYDAERAFSAYGQDLSVRTGGGWDALKADRNAGRFLIVQGEGNVPGTEAFDGGHACAVSPETDASGKWLFGDPLADGWQWVSESSIKDWANNFHSGYAWARTVAHVPPPPEPDCPPEEQHTQEELDAIRKDGYDDGMADGYAVGSQDGYDKGYREGETQGYTTGLNTYREIAGNDIDAAVMAREDALVVAWVEWYLTPTGSARWDDYTWDEGHWVKGPIFPAQDAAEALSRPPRWGESDWRQTLWSA